MGVVCCEANDSELYDPRSAQSIKIMSPNDIELWQKVDECWSQNGLSPNAGLDLESAIPLIRQIILQLSDTTYPTDEQITEIFKEIDDDGNLTIERIELFNYLKSRDQIIDIRTLNFKQPERKRRNTFTMVREREDIETSNTDNSNSIFKQRVQMLRKELEPFNFDAYTPPMKKREWKANTVAEFTGIEYEGEWSFGKKDGRGVQIWVDGTLYEGYWGNDKALGQGRMIHANGDVYEGFWMNDKQHGFGIYKHADGTVYNGNWRQDKEWGKGRETYPTGDRFTGDYVGGKKEGLGKFEWVDGSFYEGQYRNDTMDGEGTYVNKEGEYVGQWKNNQMSGKGDYSYTDGRRYKGHFVAGLKEGQGSMFWPDGRTYVGGWKDGKQHGEGKFSVNGETKTGEWNNGKRIRWID